VFLNLVAFLNANALRPLVSKVHPLSDIRNAQGDFVNKIYAGKLILIPPT
jgi:hypothetical protein